MVWRGLGKRDWVGMELVDVRDDGKAFIVADEIDSTEDPQDGTTAGAGDGSVVSTACVIICRIDAQGRMTKRSSWPEVSERG
jgi:hypothetical protein